MAPRIPFLSILRPFRSRQIRQYAAVQPPKPMSPHISFYYLYGRPIAKVFLMSYFVYQGAYYIWIKAEAREKERELETEVAELEGELDKTVKEQAEKKAQP